MPCKPCTFDYPKGGGIGVAQTLGNWGFSNEVVSPGHELSRIQNLLDRMEALREQPKHPSSSDEKKPNSSIYAVPYKPKQKSTFPISGSKPLIVFNGVDERIPTSDKFVARREAALPVYGRSYFVQRPDHWYRLGPLGCPQPSCPAPSHTRQLT